MKILYITNSLKTGGAEKLISETIPLLNNSNDLTVDLLLLCGSKEPFLEKLSSLNSCKIFKLSKNRIYNPIFIFRIIPFLRKFDLIHVHLFPSLYFVGLAKIFSVSRVKMVYTEHSTTNKRRNNFFYKCIDRAIYACYDRIITISPEVDYNIKSHLDYNPQKFILIPNGVNISSIKQEKKIPKSKISPEINNQSYVILQVSSFRYPKDQKTVIKSLPYLNTNTVLVLVGTGPLLDECKEIVSKLKLNNRVFFLGIRTDVYALMKSADIVVLSSHYEGLSLACLEGMASGRPFIASDVPGLGEIVRDAGILFAKNNYKALSKEIEKLQSDSDHYKMTVIKCQERASEYDISKNISKLKELYNSIV